MNYDPVTKEAKDEKLKELSGQIFFYAEEFIRHIAANSDLSKPRARRRLGRAIATLSSLRQAYAASEAEEAAGLDHRARYPGYGGVGMSIQSPPYIGGLPDLSDDVILEDDIERMQLPSPPETAAQHLMREAVSMLSPVIDGFKQQQEAAMLSAKVRKADIILQMETQVSLAESFGDKQRADAIRGSITSILGSPDAELAMVPIAAIPPLPDLSPPPGVEVDPVTGEVKLLPLNEGLDKAAKPLYVNPAGMQATESDIPF